MAKDRYEISLWEDYLVEGSNLAPEHYAERKVAVIGSDTMTAYCRALEPNLVENINGTNTFTFKMVYKCFNGSLDDLKYQLQVLPSQGEGAESLLDSHELQLIWSNLFFEDGVYDNPFIDLLVNERKIKVLWKDKWYDFVIKNYQKDSNGKSITFTCKDLFINELSKNGYDLEFDTKLENNQGTILELAEKVLEGTDWQLDAQGSDIVQQQKEEPVYECNVTTAFTAQNETEGGTISIPASSTILVFYSAIQEIVDDIEDKSLTTGYKYIQFLYASNYARENNSQLVINGTCCSLANAKWQVQTLNTGAKAIRIYTDNSHYFLVYYQQGVSHSYRAKRLVKSIKSTLDPLTGKYVNIYKAARTVSGVCTANDIIYEYRDTYFTDPTAVMNLAANSSDFKGLEGWVTNSQDFTLTLYPKFTESTDISTYTAKSYLKLQGTKIYANTGITELSYLVPDGFQNGEKYVLRVKVRRGDANGPTGGYYASNVLNPEIRAYTYSGSTITLGTSYFTRSNPVRNGDWYEYTMTCSKSVTRSQLYYNKVAICLSPSTSGTNYWLESIEFFKYATGKNAQGNTVRINPQELNVQSVATIRYNYYNHTQNSGLTSVEDLEYIWRESEDYPDGTLFVPQYNNDFSKIRSITISKSNRFNILQTLAETFECWLEPYIEHTQTGAFVYDNGVPRKYIRFKETRGIETGVSFEYGIDLKTIQKTVQSDQIVTKTIVSSNNNKFAENGFCSIARSTENYPRVNFILNFDYYINQGMIDSGALYRDLYLVTDYSIGYYYWLHKYNLEYDAITERLGAKKTERDKQVSYQTLYTGLIQSAEEQINTTRNGLIKIANASSWSAATKYIKANSDSVEIKSRMLTLEVLQNSKVEYINTLASVESALAALDTVIEADETRQEEILDEIKALDFRFYKKYSRYIQEGTWIDENYVDENLYYLDAQDVAYTSAFPQVSYNVSVLRLTSLDEFKNKVFNVGDIAYIEDTDFFGYTYVNSVRTPYKEKVTIAEVSSFFDEPDKDSFKIQNYKTQFEDLFQRINSATQSLKYNEGGYAKAASIVNSDGTISVQTLQESLNKATNLMYSATNNSIQQDATGLTVVDVANPNKMTKITSGGLFISTDGGRTWRNAVSSDGIAVEYLTSGNLNTNSINILDGQFPSFRWDSKGISAFEISDIGVDFSKFVRLDHYGLYGISGLPNYEPTSEDDIWRDASYGLTWKGFFLRSGYTNGYVSISSENDFQVIQTLNGEDIERIKIGAIEFEDDVPIKYGITIKNDNGDIVFDTGSDGNISITGDIQATSGHIGGMVVDNDKLTMDTIVMEPGVGIYALFPVPVNPPNLSPEDMDHDDQWDGEVTYKPAFIISDVDGSATFSNVTARGTIYAESGELGELDVIGLLTVGNDAQGRFSENVIYINGNNGTINSGNFETGVSGWSIWSDGNAEFNDIVARGTIYADSGVFDGTIYARNGELYTLDVKGLLSVGNVNNGTVLIDGRTGSASIYSSNYSTSNATGWKINYDGTADFYDINAEGGTLGNLLVTGLLTVGNPPTQQAPTNTAIYIDGTTPANAVIQSSNYVSGETGWMVNAAGGAEFANIWARGTIYADNGRFTGRIEATEGYLSGLQVRNTLTVGESSYTGLIRSYAVDSNQNPMWSINSNGLATFRNIQALGGTLGRLNVIDNLQVGADGARGIIESYNYIDGAGYGWRIDSNGDATFNNITARGAIKTAVFEYAEIQAVGGVFLFRPSSTIKSARIEENNLIVKVEKPHLFTKTQFQEFYSWCKISNYTSDGSEPYPEIDNILLTNGLTHVYQILDVDLNTKEVTLGGGRNLVRILAGEEVIEEQENNSGTGEDQEEYPVTPEEEAVLKTLEGGALVDMGRVDKSSNYGVGVNSSDNTVNLPARAISLFETNIDLDSNIKVKYDYKAILGTLPANSTLSNIYSQYLEGTQGIFTDNIYIGDNNNYLTFYTDTTDAQNPVKRMEIKASSITFRNSAGQDDTVSNAINNINNTIDEIGLEVTVLSTIGNQLLNGQGMGAIFARVTKNGTDIDYVPVDVKSGTTLPDPANTTDEYFILLSTAESTAILKKKENGAWVDAPPRVCTYIWSYSDENGSATPANEGQFIYFDSTLINKKLTATVSVTYNG